MRAAAANEVGFGLGAAAFAMAFGAATVAAVLATPAAAGGAFRAAGRITPSDAAAAGFGLPHADFL